MNGIAYARCIAILTSILCAFSLFDFRAQEKRTMYEKVSQPELIIVGTVIEDDQKYALIDIDEVLKGDYHDKTINVSFRKENFERQQGDPKILFTNGEKVLLFLDPARKESGEIKRNIFSLREGAEGKIAISPESSALLIDAVKRFIRIQSLKNQLQIWKAQKDLLNEMNRYLVEAGLQEVIKFRNADPTMVPTLLGLIRNEYSPFRSYSAIILRQLFEEEARRGSRIEGREEVITELIQKARGDDVPAVRIAAIQALMKAGADGFCEIFDAISKNDASQDVRYEAQKALYEIRLQRSEQK